MKKYFDTLWLIEVILIIALTIVNIELMIGYVSSPLTQQGLGALNAVFNTQEYYQSALKNQAATLSQDIYLKTDSLKDLLSSSPEVLNEYRQKMYQNNFYVNLPNNTSTTVQAGNTDITVTSKSNNANANQQVTTESNSGNNVVPRDIYFVIRNKETGQIFSNDPFFQGTSQLTEKQVFDAINEKYKDSNFVIYTCNNVNRYNQSVVDGTVTYSSKVIKNFEEIYYTPQSTFSSNVGDAINDLILFTISIILNVFLIMKVIILLINHKGNIEISGNFVVDLLYIFKHAFRYKGPRRTLLTTIITSIIFYIAYLYMLALGGTDNNIIVNFFKSYPFKGSFILSLLPMIGILYSVKRNIEIGMLKDSLKIINDGNFDHSIREVGGSEIRELIKNINKMKDGYNIAVEEALYNEKLKTELISNVSHDLKTPLTSIINYVNIVQDKRISEEERDEYLKILERKSIKLKQLIEDLFEVSKISSGKIELNKDEINITALIYQVIGEYSSIYEEKAIEFKVDCEEDEILIDLDGIMISRVIENIVINALKYSMNNTRVYVSIIKEDSGVLIGFKNVANYEMDFDESEIFERFARADKSRNSNIEGSGLGLAITKSIVELHGGTTRIKREGDLFKIYVYLPFNKPSEKMIHILDESEEEKEEK